MSDRGERMRASGLLDRAVRRLMADSLSSARLDAGHSAVTEGSAAGAERRAPVR